MSAQRGNRRLRNASSIAAALAILSASSASADSSLISVPNTQADLATVGPATAIDVSQTTATVTGWVDPMGSPVTDCELQWGVDLRFAGVEVPCDPGPGSGEDQVAVSAELAQLRPGTKYFVRFVAADALGTTLGQTGTLSTTSFDTRLSFSPSGHTVTMRRRGVTREKVTLTTTSGAPVASAVILVRDGHRSMSLRTARNGSVVLRLKHGQAREVVVRFAGQPGYRPVAASFWLRRRSG